MKSSSTTTGLLQRNASRQYSKNALYQSEEKKVEHSTMHHRKKHSGTELSAAAFDVRKKQSGIEIPAAFDDENPHGHNAHAHAHAHAHNAISIRQRNAIVPAAPNSANNHPRLNAKRSGRASSWMGCFVILVLMFAAAGIFVVSYHERMLMIDQMKEQDIAMQDLEVSLSMKFDSKIKKLIEEKEDLEERFKKQHHLIIENEELKQTKHQLERKLQEGNTNREAEQKLVALQEQFHKLEEFNNRLKDNRQVMKENVQTLSKKMVLEKFGPGPHYVEIFVRFDSHLGHEDGGYITLELAPLDQMPHAVHWFLEQVERGLYNGNSFYRNAGHIVQGGPTPNFMSPNDMSRAVLDDRFRDAGFHSILFQEYSPAFPHVKYTVGYAGRPGGPDFYISTQDNTVNHGPGGQSDDPTDADPCFAKVIYGNDIVDRMHNSPVREGAYLALETNVAIAHMKRIDHGNHH